MKKILLIEDDRWLAESYIKVLKRAGYDLLYAQSSQEAIGLVESQIPDVLLVDVLLDTNTIFPLLHEMQSYDDTRRIPVIVCSGLNHALMDETKLHSYGVVRVLDKQTITPEVLSLTIKEVVL